MTIEAREPVPIICDLCKGELDEVNVRNKEGQIYVVCKYCKDKVK